VHFIRVDQPFNCPRVAAQFFQAGTKTTVYCTLGAPLTTKYVAEYSFPDGTTYQQFISTVMMSRGVQARWLPIYKLFGEHGIHCPEDFDIYVVQSNITTIVESAITMLVGLEDARVHCFPWGCTASPGRVSTRRCL
jgi:hypothetical protein